MVFSAVLSFVLILGTVKTLESGNIEVASMREMLMQTPTQEQIEGARVSQPYAEDMEIGGVFNPKHTDVYVYAYVNGGFKAFKRIVSGNVFIIELPEKLKVNDSVHVEVAAFNSNYRFTSPVTNVAVRPSDMPSVVKDHYIGEFKLDKALEVGDQSIAATFDKKHSNVFVNVYVDGKYVGGRQFKNGDYFKVNLRNPLKVGDVVEVKMYSYKTKSTVSGTAVVAK